MERIGEPGGGAPDHSTALRNVRARTDLANLDVVGHFVESARLPLSAPDLPAGYQALALATPRGCRPTTATGTWRWVEVGESGL